MRMTYLLYSDIRHSINKQGLRLREERRIRVFENRMLKRKVGTKRDENWRGEKVPL